MVRFPPCGCSLPGWRNGIRGGLKIRCPQGLRGSNPLPGTESHAPTRGGRVLSARIAVNREKIAEFCRQHHIRRLSLFGSVLREDFRPDSDVDVLIEFEPGHTVGLIRLAGMERELSEIVGRKVDLRTPADLSRYFRQEVLDTAEVQYAA
jgi:uncharacterized protein